MPEAVPFKLVLDPMDGWYETVKRTLEPTSRNPNPEGEEKGEQHYFYKGKSLCGKFKTIPVDAVQNNSQNLHCPGCLENIRIMARGELG